MRGRSEHFYVVEGANDSRAAVGGERRGMYGLAWLTGFALGVTLSVPQWLVLRRYVKRAVWWILANAVAWAFGMQIIFVAASNTPPAAYLLLVL